MQNFNAFYDPVIHGKDDFGVIKKYYLIMWSNYRKLFKMENSY